MDEKEKKRFNIADALYYVFIKVQPIY